MNLYQIDNKIENIMGNLALAFDEETGEITDEELYAKCQDDLESLELSKEAKIENLVCIYKNLTAEKNAIDNEAKILLERAKRKDNAIKRLKSYLESYLIFHEVNKIETPKAQISFRKSEQLEIVDEEKAMDWAMANNLIRYKEPELDKAGMKKYLKSTGEVLEFAQIAVKQNLQIK